MYCFIVLKEWDQSHFLENLSGAETSCSMIDANGWDFSNVKKVAALRNRRIEGIFGYTEKKPGYRSTDNAIETILRNMPDVRNLS